MSYPKSVYHKDFDAEKADEASLKKHSRVVHSEEDFKRLGSDWGDHPVVKGKKEEVEPKPEKVELRKKKYSPGEGE